MEAFIPGRKGEKKTSGPTFSAKEKKGQLGSQGKGDAGTFFVGTIRSKRIYSDRAGKEKEAAPNQRATTL